MLIANRNLIKFVRVMVATTVGFVMSKSRKNWSGEMTRGEGGVIGSVCEDEDRS